MIRHGVPLVIATLFLAACGSSNESQADNLVDNETLAACATPVCPEGLLQDNRDEEEFSLQNMSCIVEAMRERTTGVYHVKLYSVASVSSEASDFTLFVTPSGDVEISVHRVSNGEENNSESWDPALRCSLAAPTFFDSCLAAVTTGEDGDATAARPCTYPGPAQELPWFEACEPQAPTCE